MRPACSVALRRGHVVVGLRAGLSDEVRTTMGGDVLPVVTVVLPAGAVYATAVGLGPSSGVAR